MHGDFMSWERSANTLKIYKKTKVSTERALLRCYLSRIYVINTQRYLLMYKCTSCTYTYLRKYMDSIMFKTWINSIQCSNMSALLQLHRYKWPSGSNNGSDVSAAQNEFEHSIHQKATALSQLASFSLANNSWSWKYAWKHQSPGISTWHTCTFLLSQQQGSFPLLMTLTPATDKPGQKLHLSCVRITQSVQVADNRSPAIVFSTPPSHPQHKANGAWASGISGSGPMKNIGFRRPWSDFQDECLTQRKHLHSASFWTHAGGIKWSGTSECIRVKGERESEAHRHSSVF